MSSRNCTALLVVILCLLVAVPLHASSTYTTRDTAHFFGFDTGPFLVDPGEIQTGAGGTVAIWDRGLQQFFFHSPAPGATSDTDSSGTDPGSPKEYRLDDLLNDFQQNKIIRKWDLSVTPESFFGSDGRFWFYNPRRSTQGGTAVLRSVYPTFSSRKLPGPIRSIVPSDDQWIIQLDREDTPLIRWDPYSDQGLVDTAPYVMTGQLLGVTQDGRYLTRSGNQIRTYREGEKLESRTFATIRDIDIQSNDVYVLTGNREVTRLNSRLTAQYTYFLPRDRSYHSLGVADELLYLSSPDGLYRAVMDETGRSFFSQSTRLSLTEVASRFPGFEDTTRGHRLWLDQTASGNRLLVKTDTSLVHSVKYRSGEFSGFKTRFVDDLSRTAFQYFQVDSTYWRGDGNLYYFFEDDKAVEQYDTEGRLIKRRSFAFDEYDIMRDLTFLGAEADNVYFSARLIDSRRGFQRFVLKYDWQGDLIRTFRLQHPFSSNEYMTATENGVWRYLGGENFYQLRTNQIVVYDNQGFPRQAISTVANPVDVARGKNALFVLDLGGDRLRAFNLPENPTQRHGLPIDLRTGEITDAQSGRMLFSGKRSGDQRLGLYEYNVNSFEYQRVLSHPKKSLRYPVMNNDGDSLFFWGTENEDSGWTLYTSDTVKYSARPLRRARNVRGTGFFAEERNLLFFPIRPSSDTGAHYEYMDPFGDTRARLGNTRRVTRIQPGGFTGYYAVKQSGDTHSIVSGYMDRDTETAPLEFVVADTLYRSTKPVLRLMPDGDRLYFSSRNQKGFSRLGSLSTSSNYSGRVTSNRDISLDWLGEFRGYVTDVTRSNDRYYLNQLTGQSTGRLYHFYAESEPASGGLQGQLTSSDPRELRGIPLRIDPGGQNTITEEAGQFSFSDVPSGYVELNPPSYNYHFDYDVDIPIRGGEYTVKQSIPLAQQEELLLLERALKYFSRGNWNKSRIPMGAFRELTQEGPYYRLTDAYMEEIHRQLGDTEAQLTLYQRRPELFSAPELLGLYSKTSDTDIRRKILSNFASALDDYFREMIRNEINVLLPNTNPSRKQSLSRPLFSSERHSLPRLNSPILKSPK